MSGTYQALYRKWRPLVFEDVVGQDHVSETLKNAVMTGRIAHAYLFCGTRGTGKTSTAKIFSRAVNCLNPQNGDPCNECEKCRGISDGSILDVYEMDAASNSGIDNIREIRDEVIYSPVDTKFKVYIIDEAHMLTTEAFNALLKTLEEPPSHVIFILATTEPHKIPATILSRCQRFDFRRIGVNNIERRLNKIVAAEQIAITPDAVELVSELADGSMRDSLSILDQCAAYSTDGRELRYDDIVDIVGIADRRVLFEIADYVCENNSGATVCAVDSFLEKGKEVFNFFDELIMHYRALMICKSTSEPGNLLEKSAETVERYKAQADKYTLDRIMYSIGCLSEYLLQAKKMSTPRVAAEMAAVKLCSSAADGTAQDLSARLDRLEKALESVKRVGIAPPVSGSNSAAAAGEYRRAAEKPSYKPAAPHEENAAEWDKWKDALKLIKQESKSLYTYLFNAKAMYFGDEIEIVISVEHIYEKINTPDGKRYLSELFSKVQGSELRAVISRPGNLKRRDGSGGASIADIAAKQGLLGDKMTVIED